jgi:hypothetical protein
LPREFGENQFHSVKFRVATHGSLPLETRA